MVLGARALFYPVIRKTRWHQTPTLFIKRQWFTPVLSSLDTLRAAYSASRLEWGDTLFLIFMFLKYS